MSRAARPAVLDSTEWHVPDVQCQDRVFAENRAYSSAAGVLPGDIVVVRYRQDGEEYRVIWRVIGIPGDDVAVTGTSVSLNGQELEHTLAREEDGRTIYSESNRGAADSVAYDSDPKPERREPFEIRVPEGYFFLMGDNRDNAWDSRFTGPVAFEQILGRILEWRERRQVAPADQTARCAHGRAAELQPSVVMARALERLGRGLTVALLAVLASQPLAAEGEEPVWSWMEECGGPRIRLELELDGAVARDATLPICRRLRSARSAHQSGVLRIRFAPPRAIVWRGYKEVPESSPADQPLELQIWDAGADPEHLILGVAVVADDTIYMNTLAIALPDVPCESRLAEGVVLRSVPVAGSRR